MTNSTTNSKGFRHVTQKCCGFGYRPLAARTCSQRATTVSAPNILKQAASMRALIEHACGQKPCLQSFLAVANGCVTTPARSLVPLRHQLSRQSQVWFPKAAAVREAWARAVNRWDGWTPKDGDRLCSMHFTAECFDKTGQTVRIRAGSLPTLFPTAHKTHSRATRAATKVQQTANQAQKQLQRRITGPNTTSSPVNDAPTQARDASLEGQPLPKKRMFNLQQDASISQPAHFEKLNSVASNGIKSEEDPDGDNISHVLEIHAEVVGQTVNRDLDSGEPGPETTATGALFLHTYCGGKKEPEQVVKLKLLLQLAKRRLGVAEQKLKRKSEAYNKLLNANKELKFELSLAQRPTQQQFSVSDRLPKELLRDWHENAGRVPHARRYSATTLRFAADLHACSRTAYEHVAQWLPMPTLYLVRRHTAMSSHCSRESGGAAVVTTPSSQSETTAVGPRDNTLPASRFASSVPRYRKLISWIPAAASKPSVSTFSSAPRAVKLANAPVVQAGHSAPTIFVIKNASPPEMGTPRDAATPPETTLSTKAATLSETTTMPETGVTTSSKTTTTPETEVTTSSETTTMPEKEVATSSDMTTMPETGVATSSETATSAEVETQVGTEVQPGTKTPLDMDKQSEGRMHETDTELNTETISGSHDSGTITDSPSVQTVTAIFVSRTLAS
ncbi:uncharacterized protein LOC119172119 isoform X3 [Rhipicephalus microplus]|uniref:uncharacterized protein LOC119172119 isoform X3 n=1 Tax=Rhipicephalus microplus TaxID=6941 RepID=UPI003F6AADD8